MKELWGSSKEGSMLITCLNTVLYVDIFLYYMKFDNRLVLKCRFGVSGADDAVKNLKFIWISHIHADHHAGLVRILALRFQLLKGVPHEPLLVIGPRQLQKFLNAYSRLEYLDMQFLDCRHTSEETINSFLHGQSLGESFYSEHTNKKDDISANQHFDQCNIIQNALDIPGSDVVDTSMVVPVLMKLKAVLSEAGLEVLYSVPVVHCPQAFGLVLKACGRKDGVGKFIPGWKLVYSGDTRPCQALIDASCDATVLIHEVRIPIWLLSSDCAVYVVMHYFC